MSALSVVSLLRLTDNKTNTVDLLSEQTWSSLPGVKRSSDGLRVKPVDLQISHNDGSNPQPNPPLSVVDPPLRVNGDFLVEAELSDLNQEASIQLYGEVPGIYDAWRAEPKSIRVDVKNNTLKVRVWDGSSLSSVDERAYKVSLHEDATTLEISHVGDSLTFSIDGRLLGSMPDHYVFTAGDVRFGFLAQSGTTGWTLSSLRVFGLNGGNVSISRYKAYEEPVSLDAQSLRNLAQSNSRKIPIGVAVSSYPFFTDERYSDIVRQQFNMMTPENEMKFQFIHPLKDTYTYEYADALVEIAQANNMAVHGHTLVTHKSNPEWVEKSAEGERKQIMVDHIKEVVGHYKGKVIEWDVINEMMSDDDLDYADQNLGLRQQLWFDAMGENYIDIAFRTAHEADPSAKLFLNEYGIGKDGMRWDALLALVKRLKERGVPIDGVGFESHVYHKKDSVNPEVLRRHIKTLADIGIISRISENDVLGDDADVQAEQYGSILRICLEEPTCVSYATWGVSDLYGSTTASDRYPLVLGDSLLWDKDFKPKLAYQALQQELKRH